MKFSTMVIPIAVFVSTITMALAASVRTKLKGPVKPDSYIVVLKSGEDMEHHIEGITRISARSPGSEFSINHRYKMLNGYSAHVTGASLSRIFSCPEVEYVEADAIVSICDGLHEVNEGLVTEFNDVPAEIRDDPGELGGRADRKPVELIVGAAGLAPFHFSFMEADGSTRVVGGAAVDPRGNPLVDLNGHGTMVAGRAAGNIYGVTTWPTIYSIKVSNSREAATTDVMRGIELAVERFESTESHSIFILTFISDFDSILNMAVNDAVKRGLPIVVPAGGGSKNVDEKVSPASAANPIAVGAIEDCTPPRVASFSNWGPTVIAFAKGTAVVPSISGAGEWQTETSTTMSAAYVAGLLAEWLSYHEKLVTPVQLKIDLKAHFSKNVRDPDGIMKWSARPFRLVPSQRSSVDAQNNSFFTQ
ncbi:uncharacterized protein EI90DRAFT_3156933 [Cantharellus anzutake]|uniref:uncharacterized protein n=1 Tax=Cantharellus anzutake TaxID=1750568 RepID=UPI0019030AAC|nr:uncharacterized protein EI90DRAFT_3156933 [Cantharellus anzutake]KAF8325572.1 hypothetical protein EI90DRAFT_3156933 [Cantharellus anzutake]